MSHQIPREVERAVRTAGESTTRYGWEVGEVYRRARRRRNRRRGATAIGATLAAIGLVGAGIVVRQHAQATRPLEPAVVSTPTGPAQRLLLAGANGQYLGTRPGAEPIELGALSIGEMRPDGGLVPLPVPGNGYDSVTGLSDGRVVVLGDVPRTTLTVDDPAGEAVQRDIKRPGERVTLVAANATTAYLWRPQGLAGFDLTNGLERLVMSSAMLDLPGDDPSAALDAADVVGDTLVLARTSASCRPELNDIDPPQGLRTLSLTALGCRATTGLRLSPSTGRVAVTYEKKPGDVWAAVLSTEDGRVLADRHVTTFDIKKPPVLVRVAWLDERNVRGVVVPLGPGVHQLQTFTIPT
ncbi:hypothetical protein KOI35_36245 [Actinoplanes bogorensis]|uniref:Uncharacterized protein n=1 Tax=Paractinoplanes bogorensis TaxID=1610840 RepID=A0ABS5YZV2_9ACTN|nr:hypothetical protein [Actinoplanes bogorensis]MBU2668977.1 hypothetical protein [Actinoplanes bogorensis]